jgi:hypothetical protein
MNRTCSACALWDETSSGTTMTRRTPASTSFA